MRHKAEGVYTCYSCGHMVEASAYAEVFRLAEEAFQLGYVYRKTYEEQERKKGSVNTLYALSPPEGWMVWSTLAILGGVAGNLAYDVAKSAVMTIYQRFAKSPRNSEVCLSQPEELEVLIEYVREYADGSSTASEAVTAAIAQEWLADWVGNHVPRLPDNASAEDYMEAFRPVILAAMNAMGDRKLIVQHELPPIGTHFVTNKAEQIKLSLGGSPDDKGCGAPP